jgi:hypothetical protein
MAAATSGLGWWAQAGAAGVIPFAKDYEFICWWCRVLDTPDVTYVIDDFEGTVVGRAGFQYIFDDYLNWMGVRVQH